MVRIDWTSRLLSSQDGGSRGGGGEGRAWVRPYENGPFRVTLVHLRNEDNMMALVSRLGIRGNSL